jgi:hypothetical protein
VGGVVNNIWISRETPTVALAAIRKCGRKKRSYQRKKGEIIRQKKGVEEKEK